MTSPFAEDLHRLVSHLNFCAETLRCRNEPVPVSLPAQGENKLHNPAITREDVERAYAITWKFRPV